MANEEQLAILRQGVEAWNEWRKKNDGFWNKLRRRKEAAPKIDLSKANLHGKALFGRKFETAAPIIYGIENPSGAQIASAYVSVGFVGSHPSGFEPVNFSGADLSGSDLGEAGLMLADLSGADLFNVNLDGANLFRANLKGAMLQKASLDGADLRLADFEGADLTSARLYGANLQSANLSNASLGKAYLFQSNLAKASLRGAKLPAAMLGGANLRGADLEQAYLYDATLVEADLQEANLSGVDLGRANLDTADLRNANLMNANLEGAALINTRVAGAKISGCRVYGISVWDLDGDFEQQRDLIITPARNTAITVDNVKVAQFVYLILKNRELRDVFNTLTSKSVLILGRFSVPRRKAVLEALKDKLRDFNLVPIVFDFERPTDRDFTETIKTLAGLSYFVIADVTNPKSSPLELQAAIPDYQIPFVPIIQEGERPFSMMVDLQKKYDWVLDTLEYDSIDTLIKALKPAIIEPAIRKHNELRLIKAREPKIRSAKDFLNK